MNLASRSHQNPNMKRPTTPDRRSPKRAKVSYPTQSTFFDQVPKQCPNDIHLRGVDEEKWLSGKFMMVWPAINGRIEALAHVHSLTSDKDVVFPIFFELGKKYLPLLKISPPSQFRLSLRGAEVRDIQMKHLYTLPIQLIFSKGVHIMWKLTGSDSDITSLDTWSSLYSFSVHFHSRANARQSPTDNSPPIMHGILQRRKEKRKHRHLQPLFCQNRVPLSNRFT